MKFDRDADGNVTNPPTDPTFEQRLRLAADSGDDREVAYVQDQYNQWRDEEVKRREALDDEPTPVPSRGSVGTDDPLAGLSDDALVAEVERRRQSTPGGGAA